MIPIECKIPSRTAPWLTPTTINTYLRCPRKYYLSRIARLPKKPNIHLIRGLAVHRTIQLFYSLEINRCALFSYPDFERILLDIFRQEWDDKKPQLQRLDLTDTEIDFYFHDSCKMIRNFARDFYQNHTIEKPAPVIEKSLISEELRLKGRIDAVHFDHTARGPPLLIDYKTSRSREITDDYKRQLLLYALLYQENFQVIPQTGIHFLNFEQGLSKIPVTASDLEQTKQLVLDIHQKTQSKDIKDYPCTCGWCQYEFPLI